MTMQCRDYVYYEGKEYTLIAIEKNTDLINSADFGLKNCYCSTGCYRGYMAEYFVEDNFLYGMKIVENYTEMPDYQKSQKLKMNYTGSLLLARNREDRLVIADFIESYLNFDEAFEFYFIDGELVEMTDLAGVIQEWNQIENALVPKKKRKSRKNRTEEIQESPEELWQIRERIAVKYLKYQYYGYKWERTT